MRDLIEVVRTAELGDADLGWATELVTDIAQRLRPKVVDGVRMQHALRYEGFTGKGDRFDPDTTDEAAAGGSLDPEEFFPYSPLVGRLNPISPPIRMWRASGASKGEVHGSAVFRSAYNGPPGSVHGGVLAATFDELLGATAVVNGLGAFTGTLSVVYKSFTPFGAKGRHARLGSPARNAARCSSRVRFVMAPSCAPRRPASSFAARSSPVFRVPAETRLPSSHALRILVPTTLIRGKTSGRHACTPAPRGGTAYGSPITSCHSWETTADPPMRHGRCWVRSPTPCPEFAWAHS